jgi:hypothetical protein
MTPKEKALQLCQKFGYLGIKWEQAEYTTLSLGNAKECALIAVDEIIKNGGTKYIIEYKPNSFTNGVGYWQEVKQEIEKL